MLLHDKYGFNIESIPKQRISIVNRLLFKAYEEENKEFLKQMWLTLYPKMDKKNFISFDDFCKKVYKDTDYSANTMTAEEIIKKAEEIKNRHQHATKK